MTVMIGASDAAFARYRPLFDAIAANVFHVGPSGAGATAKLVTQYLGYTNFIASIEGMLVAAKAGIDLETLARIVPVSAGQSRTFDNIARGVFPGTFAAGGTLDIVAKDVELACQLARDVGAPATLGALASDIYQARPGAWLGPGGISGRRPRARSDGWDRIAPWQQPGGEAMSDDRVARLLLTQEIAEFLYAEAELLDERRHDEWLALLAEDIRYWMPMRRNVKYGDTDARIHPRGRGHQLVRRGQGHTDPACAPDPDRDPLGGGAAIAHHPHGVERAVAGDRRPMPTCRARSRRSAGS